MQMINYFTVLLAYIIGLFNKVMRARDVSGLSGRQEEEGEALPSSELLELAARVTLSSGQLLELVSNDCKIGLNQRSS